MNKINSQALTPSPGWIVFLAGHDFDLSDWEQSLKSPFDPWCERLPAGDRIVLALRSKSFKLTDSADEVRDRAIPLIQRLNGALGAIQGAEPVRFDGVACIDEQGKHNSFVFLEGTAMRARAGKVMAGLVTSDENGDPLPSPPPEPSKAQKWLGASEDDDDIADFLAYAGRADNWYDIYKTYEVAIRLAGSQDSFKKLLGGSATACENMRVTANSFRHAAKSTHCPPVRRTLAEATQLLTFVVRIVLDTRLK